MAVTRTMEYNRLTMNAREFYGPYFDRLKRAQQRVLAFSHRLMKFYEAQGSAYRIVSVHSRIKTPESMLEKLRLRGLPETREAALFTLTDAVGVRIVCEHEEDVYAVAEAAREYARFLIIEEEDYIRTPKESGYRSYHMLIRMAREVQEGVEDPVTVELQIRTVEIDEAARLAHDTDYKQKTPDRESPLWKGWEPYDGEK